MCRIADFQTATHGTIAGMEFTIRQMGANDRAVWVEMRIALWPDETAREHAKMIDEMLGGEDAWGLLRKRLTAPLSGLRKLR